MHSRLAGWPAYPACILSAAELRQKLFLNKPRVERASKSRIIGADDPNCIAASRLHYHVAAARNQGISDLVFDDRHPYPCENREDGRKQQFQQEE
jgi:hypothetical protein